MALSKRAPPKIINQQIHHYLITQLSQPHIIYIMTSKVHYDTPTKAKVQGAYQFLLKKGIPVDPVEIFEEFGVRSKRTGYRILQEGAS